MQFSLWETSKNLFFFCFVSFTHTQSTSESKSAYFCLLRMRIASKSGFSKFQHKSFGYSLEKSGRPCLFTVIFSMNENPELLGGYPYFLNALLIFQNKYGTAVPVGKQVLSNTKLFSLLTETFLKIFHFVLISETCFSSSKSFAFFSSPDCTIF